MVTADDSGRVPPLNDELTFKQVGLQPRRKSNLLRYLLLLVLVAGVGSAAWYAFDAGWYGQKGMAIPVVYANKDPVKVKPAKPGGMKVPDQDKLIYQRLKPGTLPNAPSAPVERLLPRAEVPLPVPSEPKIPQAAQSATAQTDTKQAQQVLPPAVSERVPTQTNDRLAPPLPPQKVEKIIPKNLIPKKPVAQIVKRTPPPVAPTEVLLPIKKTTKIMVQPKISNAPTTLKEIESLLSKAPVKAPYRVQLAAVRSRDIAQKEWNRIKKRHNDVLGKLSLSVMRADLGAKGIYFRLRAGPLESNVKARGLCAKLAARKVPCLVVRPNG